MKKKAITLIEILIVLFLISLIGGVIGYNVKGSMKKGREFKTTQAKSRLEDVLEICLQEGMNPEAFLKDKSKTLKEYGMVKDPDSLLKDGYGNPFEITYDAKKQTFTVR